MDISRSGYRYRSGQRNLAPARDGLGIMGWPNSYSIIYQFFSGQLSCQDTKIVDNNFFNPAGFISYN